MAWNRTAEPCGAFMLLAHVPQSVLARAVQAPPLTLAFTPARGWLAETPTSTHHSLTFLAGVKDAWNEDEEDGELDEPGSVIVGRGPPLDDELDEVGALLVDEELELELEEGIGLPAVGYGRCGQAEL